MNFTQIYKIARREFIARVRNKAFIFTTIMVPVFMGAYMLVMPLLFTQTSTDQLELALVDGNTNLTDRLIGRLEAIERPIIEVRERLKTLSPDERARLNAAVVGRELDGYIVLEPDQEKFAKGRYFARETGNPVILNRLEGAIESAALEGLLDGTGVNVDRIRAVQRGDLETITISEEGEAEGGFESSFISTFIFAMLIYMAVLINGQGMAMAIVEEKSSRLIEVILGAVTATEFMIGKILGVLLSGMTQLAIWISFSVIGMLYVAPSVSMSSDIAAFDLGSIVNFRLLLYFSIFFTLGYLLYSTLFAATAATCTSTEELSQAMFPAMLPMIFALFSTFYVMSNPGTVASQVLSFIPFFTPLVMMARINVLPPPLWEVWLGILLLLVGALACAWVAAKIFRFALLLHGKRPTIPEIVRLIRSHQV